MKWRDTSLVHPLSINIVQGWMEAGEQRRGKEPPTVANQIAAEEQPTRRPHRGAESASHRSLKVSSPPSLKSRLCIFPRPSLSPLARSNQPPCLPFGHFLAPPLTIAGPVLCCVQRPRQTKTTSAADRAIRLRESRFTGQEEERPRPGLSERKKKVGTLLFLSLIRASRGPFTTHSLCPPQLGPACLRSSANPTPFAFDLAQAVVHFDPFSVAGPLPDQRQTAPASCTRSTE